MDRDVSVLREQDHGLFSSSRDDILAFLKREREAAGEAGRKSGAPIGKREIARAFGIKGDDRAELKRILKAMESEGALTRRRRGLRRMGALPDVVVAEITGRDSDGDLLAVPNAWDTAEFGAAPRILIDLPKKARRGTPVPGVGDRALLRLAPPDDADLNHLLGRDQAPAEAQGAHARRVQQPGRWRSAGPPRGKEIRLARACGRS